MRRRLLLAAVIPLVIAACGGGGADDGGDAASSEPGAADEVRWEYDGTAYRVHGTPPPCPDPILQPPTDLALATSILYPGQTRGGEYKPHGGFRFDGLVNTDVDVVSPLDGEIVHAARYLVSGDQQYTFDIVHPCGIKIRVGHLLELPPAMQAIADQLPPAQELDSRTHPVEPPVAVAVGEVLGTAVGVHEGTNVFFDFGVYDLRQPNPSSADPAYAAAHPSDTETYAVCWFDLLPADATARVRGLPSADGASGATSDYCSPTAP
jgi:hypothetical protein